MSDGIDGVKPVNKRMADGTIRIYYYHRATKQRLPDDPKSYAFKQMLDRLNQEAADQARAPKKTISTLIRDYCRSQDWLGLKASTREIETFNLKAIEAEFGDMSLEEVEERGARALFLEWRDELAQTHPRAADAKLARLARVFSFGIDREHLVVNPLATFRRVYASDRSDIVWLPDHIDAFMKVANDRMQLALVLGLHTGQRQGDIRSLRWDQYDGTAIQLTQSKGGVDVYVPCTAALKETLDGIERGSEYILTTKRGNKQWTRMGFRSEWDRTFELSGIKDDLHYHDLRGTAVTMLAEAGASVPEIATITGHTLESVNKILERYLSRTKAMAHSAIAKLETRMKNGNGGC